MNERSSDNEFTTSAESTISNVLFRHSPVPISCHRYPTGEMLDVNDSWLRLVGCERNTALSDQHLFEILTPGAVEFVGQELTAFRPVYDYPVSIRLVSGEIRSVLMSTVRVMIDQVDSQLTSMVDLTEWHRAESARHEIDTRLRTIVETMVEGVIVHANDGSVVSCNRAAESILGVTEAQLKNTADLDACPRFMNADSTVLPAADHPWSIVLRTGEPCLDRQMVVVTKGGTKRHLSV